MSLAVGTFVGSAAGYVGSIMVSKRMALVGDALSHVALPGLALGLLLNFNPFLGAFAFLATTAVITWYVEKSTALSAEAIIGVLFVLALAIGILITPQVDLLDALFGNISSVTIVDVIVTAVISVSVVLAVRAVYPKIALSMVSKELAVSSGIKVERINLIYLLLVVTVVAVGIKEVGTLLVGAVVIVPAAAARNISSTLSRYSMTSALFGLVSAIAGVVLSGFVAVPAGPLVVITGAALFAVTFVARRASYSRQTATSGEER
ncbi:MAG: metal ABC transporter permease [Nitrososphaerota archaeon]|nr:metal ABC transporter permease [Nitrososphaerota archaeon]